MIHQRIHRLAHLTAQQFDRWTALFTSTVDNHFEGEKAELAKQQGTKYFGNNENQNIKLPIKGLPLIQSRPKKPLGLIV